MENLIHNMANNGPNSNLEREYFFKENEAPVVNLKKSMEDFQKKVANAMLKCNDIFTSQLEIFDLAF